MKILILSSEFPPGPGGIGIHAWQLAWHFQQSGMQVAVFAAQDHAAPEEIRQFNCQQPFIIMPFGGSPLHRALNCWKAVDEWQPDFLLASGLRLAEMTAVLTLVNKNPWFGEGHGSEFLILKD
jgi:phosphatidylinositol alpha-1,6-mannosyltransferase